MDLIKMKIIIAPDSFKESLTSPEVAAEIANGFREVFPHADLIELPIADGGEGTVEALLAATAGQRLSARVMGPLQQPVEAAYGLCGDSQTVVIEMAAASGLHLVPEEQRNPLHTTSFGTGELIKHALDSGYRKFIIGLGGSATNDAGAGMLQALGVKFLNQQGQEIGSTGGALNELEKIDSSGLDPRLKDTHIEVACDVDNPLTGPRGASAIFGPQKGATATIVEELDQSLARFADRVRRDLGKDIENMSGAGAAGGMGAAMLAFLDADLKPGVDIVLEQVGLEQLLTDADLVITGEGRLDGQTAFGKAPAGVAKAASKHNIPVIAIAGSLGEGVESLNEYGIHAFFSVVPGPCTLAAALSNAATNIRLTAKNIAAVIRLSKLK